MAQSDMGFPGSIESPGRDDEANIESIRDLKVVSSHPPPPPSLRQRVANRHPHPMTVKTVNGEPRVAADLMTRQLFTVEPEDTLEGLEERMDQFRFRHLPVVEGDGFVGLITRSDLLHLSSSSLSKSAPEENVILHQLTASRIMKRDCVTARPSDPLLTIATLMWECRVGCVPVTEEDGTLVGILTEGDFVRLAYHFLLHGEVTH